MNFFENNVFWPENWSFEDLDFDFEDPFEPLNKNVEFPLKEYDNQKIEEDLKLKNGEIPKLELIDAIGDMGPVPKIVSRKTLTINSERIDIQNSYNSNSIIPHSSFWKVESQIDIININKRNEPEKIFSLEIPCLNSPIKRELLTNKEIIERIISYLDLFNEKKRSKKEMAKLRKEFSVEVKIPKKTIDDYIMNLKWAIRLNFPFDNYLNQGFGYIRKFVKFNLGKRKKSVLKKEVKEIGEIISLKTLPKLLGNIIR